MTIITAPQGAIFSLLAIAANAPLAPNEDAELWLHEQALLGHSVDGAVLQVTPRGYAFIAMLEATPLPVRVERWHDPRGNDAPPPPAPATDALATLVSLLTAAVRPGAMPAVTLPSPPPRAPALTASAELPAGWTANTFTDLPPGQIPVILQRDHEIMVLRRDGRRVINFAGTVIFKHNGKPEDVLGWIRTGDPTDSMTMPVQVASTQAT